MLEKKNIPHFIRWFALFFLVLFCLETVGFQESILKKKCNITIDLAQIDQGKFSDPIFNLTQQHPQLVCILQFFCFKQKLECFQAKKSLISCIPILNLGKYMTLVHSDCFLEQKRSYQFARLNVLSAQHHPPTIT